LEPSVDGVVDGPVVDGTGVVDEDGEEISDDGYSDNDDDGERDKD